MFWLIYTAVSDLKPHATRICVIFHMRRFSPLFVGSMFSELSYRTKAEINTALFLHKTTFATIFVQPTGLQDQGWYTVNMQLYLFTKQYYFATIFVQSDWVRRPRLRYGKHWIIYFQNNPGNHFLYSHTV